MKKRQYLSLIVLLIFLVGSLGVYALPPPLVSGSSSIPANSKAGGIRVEETENKEVFSDD